MSQSLAVGSEEHKTLFCRMLLDTFDPYRPAVIAWPNLDDDALARLTALPFWDVAVETEGFASARVKAYAEALSDPLLKEAVSLNAFEESRHKQVLEHMLIFYNIPLREGPDYVTDGDAEWAFMRTGYGECFDSFFAFGLFELARRSGFFPTELVEVFEPVIREEGRHILFFVNWVSWRAASLPWHKRVFFRARCLAALLVNAVGRVSLAGGLGGGKNNQGNDNFVVSGGQNLSVDISLREFLDVCVAENDKRLSPYDPRLQRPMLMPRLIKFVRFFIPRKGAHA